MSVCKEGMESEKQFNIGGFLQAKDEVLKEGVTAELDTEQSDGKLFQSENQ